MSQDPKTLSLTEHSVFRDCEACIERSLQTFSEVGEALLKIRDERLYRAKYRTFEIYCQERWNWSKTHANRQIEAARVARNLSPMGDKADPIRDVKDQNLTPMGVTPESERQVRALAKLPAEEQRAVWDEAVQEAGAKPPTAQGVAVVVARRHAGRAHHATFRPDPKDSPLANDLRRKHEADEAHHRLVVELMLALDCLSEPLFDLDRAVHEILMADRHRTYEAHARAAQKTLTRLAGAMAHFKIEEAG